VDPPQIGKIVVGLVRGRKPGTGLEGTGLRLALAAEGAGQTVAAGGIEIQFASKLVKVRWMVRLAEQSTRANPFAIAANVVGAGRDQAGRDVLFGHGIDLGGIDDALSRERRVGLEKRIRLQKGHQVGLGTAAGSGMREIAGQHFRCERAYRIGFKEGLSLSFITGEPEQLVSLYGTADGEPILVAMELGLFQSVLLVEVSVGVERVIAVKFENGAVVLVGAGLGYHTDDSAGVAAVLRGVVAGKNPKLLDGIGIWIEHNSVTQQVVVHAPVQDICNRVGARASDIEEAGAAVAGVDSIGDSHTGLQRGQVQRVTPVQRQANDRLSRHRGPQSRVHRLYQRRL